MRSAIRETPKCLSMRDVGGCTGAFDFAGVGDDGAVAEEGSRVFRRRLERFHILNGAACRLAPEYPQCAE